jgi:isoleucyl-tRNA synthetase
VDLSAFYLDILKDRLYTSRSDAKARRAGQTTIYFVADYLVRLIAPVLVFTSDEVWQFMPKEQGSGVRGQGSETSVHLAAFPKAPKEWIDDKLEKKWDTLLQIKGEIAKAMEIARKDKVIGHPLDAMVRVMPPKELEEFIKENASVLKEILIVSQLVLETGEGSAFESQEVPGLKVWVVPAKGKKCERCWNYSERVGDNVEHPNICERCCEAVD